MRPLFSTTPDRNLLYLVLILLILALITAFQPALGLAWKGAAALLVATMVLDFFQARRIVPPKLTRRVRGSIPVGVWSPVELLLENRSGHGLSLVVHDFHPPDYGVEGQPREFKLPAGRSATLVYRILPERRGDGHFNGSDIVLRSPLRLWRRKIHLPLQETVRVFPNFREIAHFALLATDNKLSQLGVRHRRRRGEGSDFHQLREYRAGDTMRQIDWKASSRYRRLISKRSIRTNGINSLSFCWIAVAICVTWMGGEPISIMRSMPCCCLPMSRRDRGMRWVFSPLAGRSGGSHRPRGVV
ncbi:MAG: DUF58 domain-containing protein [Chromatiales bacterium]